MGAVRVRLLETWIDGEGRERHTILWVKAQTEVVRVVVREEADS